MLARADQVNCEFSSVCWEAKMVKGAWKVGKVVAGHCRPPRELFRHASMVRECCVEIVQSGADVVLADVVKREYTDL